MYAGVVSYRFRPERVADATRVWQKLAHDTRKQVRGYEGALFLTDPKTGEGLGIGLWSTKSDADAFGQSRLVSDFMNAISDMATQRPTRREYEVVTDLSAT